MAEGTTVKPNDVVCRFFFNTTCRDGDKCLFSHDGTRRIPDSVCRYYQQGTCIFEQNCRYDHIRVKKENNFQPNNDVQSGRRSQRLNRDFMGTNQSSELRMERLCPLKSSLTNKTSNINGSVSTPANWVNAPVFVPKSTKSYADTVKANIVEPVNMPPMELCPLFMIGECPFQEQCLYVHGNVCELCNRACLHPFDELQQKAHTEQCEKELEQDMNLSFAIQDSMDKTCGICMDVVLKKEPMSERRFGILEKCKHVFCLSCIRKWRSVNEHASDRRLGFASTVIRSCPECRIASDFIIPNAYFVDSEEEKNKLIADYKKALNKKRCKYFKQGQGTCPFGGACFYLHDKPDGTKVDLPLPRRRRRLNQDGGVDYLDEVSLWDYFVNRDSDSEFIIGLFESDDDDDVVNDYSLLRDILNNISF